MLEYVTTYQVISSAIGHIISIQNDGHYLQIKSTPSHIISTDIIQKYIQLMYVMFDTNNEDMSRLLEERQTPQAKLHLLLRPSVKEWTQNANQWPMESLNESGCILLADP